MSKIELTDSPTLSFDIEVYLPIQSSVNKSDSNWKNDSENWKYKKGEQPKRGATICAQNMIWIDTLEGQRDDWEMELIE